MSRKITTLATDYFARGNKFKRDNTEVRRVGDDVQMLLHGHIIATRRLYTKGIMVVSMCGWDTPTTRERLNGLLPHGLRISQHQGKQVWQVLAGTDWISKGLADGVVDPNAAYIINSNTHEVEVFHG